MEKVTGDLLTNKYTVIYHKDKGYQKYGAPHHSKVFAISNVLLLYIIDYLDTLLYNIVDN